VPIKLNGGTISAAHVMGKTPIAGTWSLNSPYTLACRINFSAVTAGQFTLLMAFDDGSTLGSAQDGAYMFRDNSSVTGTNMGFWNVENGGSTGASTIRLGSGVYANVGTWKHVCMTWDGSTVVGYLDGVQIATGASATGSRTTPTTMYIGPGLFSAVDVLITQRALSAAEVVKLARGRKPTLDRSVSTVWIPCFNAASINGTCIDLAGDSTNNFVDTSTGGTAPQVDTAIANPPTPWAIDTPQIIYVPATVLQINTPTGTVLLTGTAATTVTETQGNATGTLLVTGQAAVSAFAAMGGPTGTVNLTGAAAMAQSAAMTPTGTVQLTGVAATTKAETQGNATGTVALTGTAATGAMVATGNATGTVQLTGTVATGTSGAVAPTGTVQLTGIVATTTSAAMAPTGAVLLTGEVAMTSSTGTPINTPTGVVELTGAAAMTATEAAAASGTVQVTGVAAMTATGAISAPSAVLLTGTVQMGITFAVAASGTLNLTGVAATGLTGDVAPSGTVRLTGSAAFDTSATFVASAGTLLTGTCAMTGGTPVVPTGPGAGPGYYKSSITRRDLASRHTRRSVRYGR
jgi:hypothetical protein